MKTTLKSAIFGAVAACIGFAAVPAAQAQDIFIDDVQSEGQLFQQVNDVYFDDHPNLRRHKLRRHYRHHNGLSLSFQFGNSRHYDEPRYPRRVIRVSQAHVEWCYSRYRSYDHRSNSFVIRHGKRAYCVSPYSY